VDADRVHREFLHRIRSEESAEDGDIINLIMDQIEFCDLIVLNKTDLLTQQQVDEVRGALREIQQKAEIISCVQGEVAFDKIVHGRIFNYDAVADSSVMQRTLDAGNKEACTDEYGISSFLYEDRRPLNRDKFVRFVENYPEELIRTKGYVWFSDDPVHAQLFEQAGRNASITEMTEWMCAIPQQELDALIRDFPDLTADWDEQYGDRIVQLVFIGKDFRQEEILGRMEGCTDVSCPVSE
jgi:G3E family GTPase